MLHGAKFDNQRYSPKNPLIGLLVFSITLQKVKGLTVKSAPSIVSDRITEIQASVAGLRLKNSPEHHLAYAQLLPESSASFP